MVRFVFWKLVFIKSYHQNIAVTHPAFSNALIAIFFEVFYEPHFTAIIIREGNPLIPNCRLTFDDIIIIFIFMKDKVVFEI